MYLKVLRRFKFLSSNVYIVHARSHAHTRTYIHTYMHENSSDNSHYREEIEKIFLSGRDMFVKLHSTRNRQEEMKSWRNWEEKKKKNNVHVDDHHSIQLTSASTPAYIFIRSATYSVRRHEDTTPRARRRRTTTSTGNIIVRFFATYARLSGVR